MCQRSDYPPYDTAEHPPHWRQGDSVQLDRDGLWADGGQELYRGDVGRITGWQGVTNVVVTFSDKRCVSVPWQWLVYAERMVGHKGFRR